MSTPNYYTGDEPIDCKPYYNEDGSWAGFDTNEGSLIINKETHQVMPKNGECNTLVHDDFGNVQFEWVRKAPLNLKFEFLTLDGKNIYQGRPLKAIPAIKFHEDWDEDRLYEENNLLGSAVSMQRQEQIVNIVERLRSYSELCKKTDNDVVRLSVFLHIRYLLMEMLNDMRSNEEGRLQSAELTASRKERRIEEAEQDRQTVKKTKQDSKEAKKGTRTPGGRKRKLKLRTKADLVKDWNKSSEIFDKFLHWMALSKQKTQDELTDAEAQEAHNKFSRYFNIVNGKIWAADKQDTHEAADFLINHLNRLLPKDKQLNVSELIAPENLDDADQYVNDAEADQWAKEQGGVNDGDDTTEPVEKRSRSGDVEA